MCLFSFHGTGQGTESFKVKKKYGGILQIYINDSLNYSAHYPYFRVVCLPLSEIRNNFDTRFNHP